MTELYTLEFLKETRAELKKSNKIIRMITLALLIFGIIFVIFRNKENHFPSILLLSVIWTLGLWVIMAYMLMKILPLKCDILFCKKIINSEKRELLGNVVDCEEEITMQRIPCYVLKICTVENDKRTFRQIYLDKRFYINEIKEGIKIRVQIAQHFICAFEVEDYHE